MSENECKKRTIWGAGIGILVLAALYGWHVFAGEISTDVNQIVANIGVVNKNQLAPDPNQVQLLEQVAGTVELVQNEGISAGMYSFGPLAPSPGAARAATVVASHFSSFCAPSDTGPEKGNCPSDPLLQYGDAKISSLLSGTSLNSARAAAATQFLYNLIPIPSNNFYQLMQGSDGSIGANNLLNAPTSGPNATLYQNPTQQWADAFSAQALLSIARQPFAEMIAKRTPPQSQSPGPAGVSESVMQMMERIGIQRAMSSAWAENLKNLKTEEVLSDQAKMQAYLVWMAFEQYKQMERIEALLAAMVVQNYNSSQALGGQLSAQPTGLPSGTGGMGP